MGRLFSLPLTVVFPPPVLAEVRIGKFCRSFDPEVYAQLAVGEDGVAHDAHARGAAHVHAVEEVAQSAHAVGLGADQVVLDPDIVDGADA